MFQQHTSLSSLAGVKTYAENRKDTYIVISPRFGIKMRGGQGWELKTRTAVSDRVTGLEMWSKENVPDITGLTTLLSKKKAEQDEIEAAERCEMVVVTKCREKQWQGGVMVEQAELSVTVEGEKEQWRSYCVEGEEDRIEQWLQGRDLEENTIIMGYPQWVCTLGHEN